MKATITQRFELDGCEVDAEADCRFIFFFEQQPSTGDWLAKYVRHWYEKDKLVPVDPRHIPTLDDEILKSYPRGSRYLAHCQQRAMGIAISKDLPGHARDSGTINGSKHDLFVRSVEREFLLRGQRKVKVKERYVNVCEPKVV
ncbi:hypothetical protein LTR86_008703 [Recurvomyces mirabilis]|nr:hypothetical protein LTR86_008703 [Recurvomyces mirabilis]